MSNEQWGRPADYQSGNVPPAPPKDAKYRPVNQMGQPPPEPAPPAQPDGDVIVITGERPWRKWGGIAVAGVLATAIAVWGIRSCGDDGNDDKALVPTATATELIAPTATQGIQWPIVHEYKGQEYLCGPDIEAKAGSLIVEVYNTEVACEPTGDVENQTPIPVAPTSTEQPTQTAAPTETSTPEPTETPMPTATAVPSPTSTHTPIPTPTMTPEPTPTQVIPTPVSPENNDELKEWFDIPTYQTAVYESDANMIVSGDIILPGVNNADGIDDNPETGLLTIFRTAGVYYSAERRGATAYVYNNEVDNEIIYSHAIHMSVTGCDYRSTNYRTNSDREPDGCDIVRVQIVEGNSVIESYLHPFRKNSHHPLP